MDEYTPTTEQILNAWAPTHLGSWKYRREEFYRWLADHDRNVATKALEDAADALWAENDTEDGLNVVGWLRARATARTSADAVEFEPGDRVVEVDHMGVPLVGTVVTDTSLRTKRVDVLPLDPTPWVGKGTGTRYPFTLGGEPARRFVRWEPRNGFEQDEGMYDTARTGSST